MARTYWGYKRQRRRRERWVARYERAEQRRREREPKRIGPGTILFVAIVIGAILIARISGWAALVFFLVGYPLGGFLILYWKAARAARIRRGVPPQSTEARLQPGTTSVVIEAIDTVSAKINRAADKLEADTARIKREMSDVRRQEERS